MVAYRLRSQYITVDCKEPGMLPGVLGRVIYFSAHNGNPSPRRALCGGGGGRSGGMIPQEDFEN